MDVGSPKNANGLSIRRDTLSSSVGDVSSHAPMFRGNCLHAARSHNGDGGRSPAARHISVDQAGDEGQGEDGGEKQEAA